MKIEYDKELSEEEIINFWSNLGFLEGLTSFNKKQTALAYDRAAKYLHKNLEGNEDFETSIFPVIRRIITGLNEAVFYYRGSNEVDDEARRKYLIKNLNVEDILNKLNITYDELTSVIEKLNKNNEIDLEAETIALFCEIQVKALTRSLNKYDIFIKENGECVLFAKIK